MAESTVKVVFLGDASKLKKEMDSVEGATSKAEGGFGKLGAAIGGAIAVGSVVSFGKSAFDAAIESQKIAAQTEAVIKSTGSAAGITAGEIGAMSEALSKKNAVDDEAIQTGQNLLLTFTNIGKADKIFERTTQASIDMAAALGTDVTSAAMQLGKALNDPADGLSKLSRAGIQFTAEQEKQIKTMQKAGDMAGAQKVMLGELERQFGGSAAAQATATDRMKVAMGNLQEQIGAKLIPIVEKVSTWVVSSGIPAFERFASMIGDKLGPVLAEIIGSFRAFVFAFKAGDGDITSSGLPGFFERVGYWARLTFNYLRDNIPPIIDWLRVNIPPVMAAIAAASERAFGWMRENIPPILAAIRAAIETAVTAIADWWRTHWEDIRAVVELVITVIRTIIETTLAAIEAFWRTWGGTITRLVTGVFDGFRQIIEGALTAIRGVLDVIMGLIRGDWGRAWDGVKQIVSGMWDMINGYVDIAMTYMRTLIEIGMRLVAGVFDAAWDGIKAVFFAAFDAVLGAARSYLDLILGVYVGLGVGIANVVRGIGSTLSEWVSLVWGYGGMVVDFFREIPGRLGDFFYGLAETITAPFRAAFNAIARLWNSTIGSLSFSIPSWVPFGLGGNGWDVPDIPYMHTGGIVSGVGDQLRVLEGGEGVFTREQMAAIGRGGGGGGNVINITVNGSRSPQATADTVARALMSSQVRVALAGA